FESVAEQALDRRLLPSRVDADLAEQLSKRNYLGQGANCLRTPVPCCRSLGLAHDRFVQHGVACSDDQAAEHDGTGSQAETPTVVCNNENHGGRLGTGSIEERRMVGPYIGSALGAPSGH